MVKITWIFFICMYHVKYLAPGGAVLDLVSQVCDTVLMSVYLEVRKPQGVGILE
jgi:hypothetical protein